MEKSMDWVKKRNLMVRYIEVSSLKITGMEMGFKTFRRARNILASIKTAKGTAQESVLGLTGKNMRDNTLTINGRDVECFWKKVVRSTMEIGKTVKRTVL